MKKQFIAVLMVIALLVSATPASAQSMSMSDLIDMLVKVGIISADKAAAAKIAAGVTPVNNNSVITTVPTLKLKVLALDGIYTDTVIKPQVQEAVNFVKNVYGLTIVPEFLTNSPWGHTFNMEGKCSTASDKTCVMVNQDNLDSIDRQNLREFKDADMLLLYWKSSPYIPTQGSNTYGPNGGIKTANAQIPYATMAVDPDWWTASRTDGFTTTGAQLTTNAVVNMLYSIREAKGVCPALSSTNEKLENYEYEKTRLSNLKKDCGYGFLTPVSTGGTTSTLGNAIAKVIGAPTLKLDVAQTNRRGSQPTEVALTGTFTVEVTAEDGDIEILSDYFHGYFLNTIMKGGEKVITNSTQNIVTIPTSGVERSKDSYGRNTVIIRENNSARFIMTITGKPTEMFAGNYQAYLQGFDILGKVVLSNRINQNVSVSGTNTTNNVVIIGEKAPYISSVLNSTEAKVSDNVININGVRFPSLVNLTFQNYTNGKTYSGKISSVSTTKISFTPTDFGLSGGNYSVYINSSEGQSNKVGFEIGGNTNATKTLSPITVLSPNGGEKYVANSEQIIRWSGGQFTDGSYPGVDISLVPNCTDTDGPRSCIKQGIQSKLMTVTRGALVSSNMKWGVGQVYKLNNDTKTYTVPAGEYYMKVCAQDRADVCDMSDSYFTLTNMDVSTIVEQVPVISSVSPISNRIGDTITITGTNLAGFESDPNLIIENSSGQIGYPLYETSDWKSFRVKLVEKICTKNLEGVGGACPSYITLVPGTYQIYANPYGKKSNVMKFRVLAPEAPKPTLQINTPYGGQSFKKGDSVNVSWNATNIKSQKFNIRLVRDGSGGASRMVILPDGSFSSASLAICSETSRFIAKVGDSYSFSWKAGYDMNGNDLKLPSNAKYQFDINNCQDGDMTVATVRDWTDSGFTIIDPATQLNVNAQLVPAPAVPATPKLQINSITTPAPVMGPIDLRTQRVSDVTNLYRTLLNREPDQAGLDGWVGSTLSIDEIKAQFIASDEYKNIQKAKGNSGAVIFGGFDVTRFVNLFR